MFKSWTLAILIIINLLITSPSFAKNQTEQIDDAINTYVSNKEFMGTILVAKGNDIIFNKAYGFANLEWDTPSTTTTKFRIGSITKQFTAASILLLEQQGKLKTTDLISKYISDAPASWNNITIFHLLTHSSGIPEIVFMPEFQTRQLSPSTPEQTIKIFRDKPLDFQPGERMSYSDSGYIVLGAIIEKVSGKTYETFLQENIFAPLGMKDSGYDSNTAIIPHRAAGYAQGEHGLVNADYTHMSMPHACGALYSNTEDLLKWEQALFSGKVLSAASYKKMITPYKDNYALGLFVYQNNGHSIVEHSGSIQGFHAKLRYYPKEKLTYIVLSNISSDAPEKIVDDLVNIMQSKK